MFAVAWYVGDVCSVAAGLPTLILQARYSRGHEREAGACAATMLGENGISPGRLADILERMETAHSEKTEAGGDRQSGGFEDYIASHPATRERIRALRKE